MSADDLVKSPSYAEKVKNWSRMQGWGVEMDAFLACGEDRVRGAVLDIGCGAGHAAPKLLNLGCTKYRGVDVNPNYDYGEIAPDSITSVYDGRSFPFEKSTFDAAIFFHSLAHTQDPLLMLSEAIRVVRPGGCIGIAAANNTHTKIYGYVGRPTPDLTAVSPMNRDLLRRNIQHALKTSARGKPDAEIRTKSWGGRLARVGPRPRIHAWFGV